MNQSIFEEPTAIAWNRGFDAGAKAQREADIDNIVELLETLEEMEGIGEKTAFKIRALFMERFRNEN